MKYLAEGENRLDVAMPPIPIVPFDPWGYDTDGSCYIEMAELMRAVNDYNTGLITEEQVAQVRELWENNIKNPACLAPPPPYQVYTVGVYYLYRAGDEGSSDPEEWHSDWDSWCRWITGSETTLFANYCDGSMPIQWVYPFAFRRRDYLTENVHQYGGTVLTELMALPNFNTVDIKIVVVEKRTLAASMFAGHSTVFVVGLEVEHTVRAKLGQSGYIDGIADFLPHELGHLFGLGECSAVNRPCAMVPGNNWVSYQQWLDYGQKLWFCDKDRIQLLQNWGARNHG